MNLVKEDCRWRRFDFVELVPQKRNSVVTGARNMQEIVAARIANPRQLFLIITNHNL